MEDLIAEAARKHNPSAFSSPPNSKTGGVVAPVARRPLDLVSCAMVETRRARWSRVAALVCGVLLAACSSGDAPDPAAAARVGKDKVISLEYTLRVDGDDVVDSNVGEEPLSYIHGNGELVAALEAALEGMAIGDEKRVVIEAKDGYGLVDPERVQEVPIALVAPDAREPGTQIQTRGPHGKPVYMRVKEVKKDTIVMDMNHPLAGKRLDFQVKVVSIE